MFKPTPRQLLAAAITAQQASIAAQRTAFEDARADNAPAHIIDAFVEIMELAEQNLRQLQILHDDTDRHPEDFFS